MKRTPNAQRIAEYDNLKARISALEVALRLVVTTNPTAVERFREPDSDCRYTLALYGGERYDGGYLVTTFHCPRQPDSAYLDGLIDDQTARYGSETEHRRNIAVDRLKLARAGLFACA
jgi:hypothetical protein